MAALSIGFSLEHRENIGPVLFSESTGRPGFSFSSPEVAVNGSLTDSTFSRAGERLNFTKSLGMKLTKLKLA
jgi:hypothetical protein